MGPSGHRGGAGLPALTGTAARLLQQGLEFRHPRFRRMPGGAFSRKPCLRLLPRGAFPRKARLRFLPRLFLPLPSLVGFGKVRQVLTGRRIVKAQPSSGQPQLQSQHSARQRQRTVRQLPLRQPLILPCDQLQALQSGGR